MEGAIYKISTISALFLFLRHTESSIAEQTFMDMKELFTKISTISALFLFLRHTESSIAEQTFMDMKKNGLSMISI